MCEEGRKKGKRKGGRHGGKEKPATQGGVHIHVLLVGCVLWGRKKVD